MTDTVSDEVVKAALRAELAAGRGFVPANHPAAKIPFVLALLDRLSRDLEHSTCIALEGE